ncbi:hypothetical protein A2U01_0067811, partial [Trifolium medium]|nr:hypothetical protein [Trifolium medium]
MLPPGKLNDQRNLVCHKKSTSRSLIQPSLASVQPATLPQLTEPAQLVSPAQPAAPSNLTPSHIHASTPE